MNPYQQLPAPPSTLSAKTLLIRLLDSIGFRYHLATDGLTTAEYEFRPVEGSMNMLELQHHIYRVLFWAYRAFHPDAKLNRELTGFEAYRNEILQLCHIFKERLLDMQADEIENTSIYLRRTDTHYPFWYLINGPITDVLTHIGQINSWRRMAGNPCPRVSPFSGEAY